MIFSIIRQQLSGSINISLPFIIFYYFAPQYALSFAGITVYSLLVGLYIAYVVYITTRNQAKSFLFIPTDDRKKQFDNEISRCGLDLKDVTIRYAYVDDAVALTFFNTIAVDPMVWSSIQEDPEALKAREVVEKYVIPSVPENKKELHNAISSNLSLAAQKFIFRHELAHIFYNYSTKRIVITGIMAAIAALAALFFAYKVIPILGGFFTLVACICLGALIDLLLGYAVNYFFKSYEEKRADIFATRFSSKEEIKAAADFFENYEQAAQRYRKTIDSKIFSLPATIYGGYIDGITRAHYLREFAQLK